MTTTLNIYIDRLTGGKVELIDEELQPDFLSVKDGQLKFNSPIKVSGKAYLAEEFLVLNLNIETSYTFFCTVCAEEMTASFLKEGLYLTEEIVQIPSHVYDVVPQIRDTIFLDIPAYQECGGECSQREELKKYLKNPPPENRSTG